MTVHNYNRLAQVRGQPQTAARSKSKALWVGVDYQIERGNSIQRCDPWRRTEKASAGDTIAVVSTTHNRSHEDTIASAKRCSVRDCISKSKTRLNASTFVWIEVIAR